METHETNFDKHFDQAGLNLIQIFLYSDEHNSLLYNDILSEICPQLDSRYTETIGDHPKSPMCSCIRTNEGISSLFPEIPSEPLGRVPLHPSSDIYPSLQGGINLQNPRLPPRFECFGHNAYFLGPQNFCPQQQNQKKMRPFLKLPKGRVQKIKKEI